MSSPLRKTMSSDPIENLKIVPPKGILKRSAGLEDLMYFKAPKLDEMNESKTLHPSDKDNGDTNIDDSQVPNEQKVCKDDHIEVGSPNAEELKNILDEEDNSKMDDDTNIEELKKIPNEDDNEMIDDDSSKELKKRAEEANEESVEEEESQEEDDRTPEYKMTKQEFEQKRKEHYNEFRTAKLMAEKMHGSEDDDEDDDDNDNVNNEDDDDDDNDNVNDEDDDDDNSVNDEDDDDDDDENSVNDDNDEEEFYETDDDDVIIIN